MKSLNTNKVLFSAYDSSKTREANYANHQKALELLRREGITNPLVVSGVYKGNFEMAIVLESHSFKTHSENLQIASNMGLLFNQESILEIHNDNKAALHFLGVHSTSPSLSVGEWTEVSEADMILLASYTKVGDRYFVCK